MPSKGKKYAVVPTAKGPTVASPPFDGLCPFTDDGTCTDYERLIEAAEIALDAIINERLDNIKLSLEPSWTSTIRPAR